MEKYCKSCGRVFKDSDFKICPYCGNQLSTRVGRQPIPRKLRHQVFQRDNYRCRECGATNKQTRLHVDHIVPVAKGGTNDLSNLQTLCEKCNHAKYTDEWVGGESNSDSTNNISHDKYWKKCSYCGVKIPKSIKICYYCKNKDTSKNKGTSKNKEYYCENCCTEIASNGEHCPHCGSIRIRKLSESELKIKHKLNLKKIKHEVKLKLYCENCCTEIPPNSEHCPHCGSIRVRNPNENESEYNYLRKVNRCPSQGL